MNLSISNIAWADEKDEYVYNLMRNIGYSGLEIAPTRIIEENPYDNIQFARAWSSRLYQEYGLHVSSMQSIWYGKVERIWGSAAERSSLIEYTKKAIDFANAIECKNLVFGCPRNRIREANDEIEAAIEFFGILGEYALSNSTCIAMEANPVIYNTNFLNYTEETVEFINKVNNKGVRLNLDIGTMIYNEEKVDTINNCFDIINHIHISEPQLVEIREREIHQELATAVRENQYERFVSIEMKLVEDINKLEDILRYIYSVFV